MERVNYRYRLCVDLIFGNEPKEDKKWRATKVTETLKHLGWCFDPPTVGAWFVDDSEDLCNISLFFDCVNVDAPIIPGDLEFESLRVWAEPIPSL